VAAPARHEILLKMKRTLRLVPVRDVCCIYCGGPAVYSAESRWGDNLRVRALCEIHGRAFAIRWDVELPEPPRREQWAV
jgi:hypothetical protein